MALYKFSQAILNNQPIELYNQGKHSRDFTYIDDIVSGIIASIDRCHGYEIFNLGNNRPIELEKFVSLIEKNLGVEAVKKYLPLQVGDVEKTWADIDKAERMLSFKPQVDIADGIERSLSWYKDYYKKINI
jgi:UDP-glucuronate 4-epimerase